MREPRQPNRYGVLKDAHGPALESNKEVGDPSVTPVVQELTSEERAEVRLTAFEREQREKMEKGLISRVEYGHRIRQFDNEEMIAARREHAVAASQKSGDSPTLSAEQVRQAELSPAKVEERQRADEPALQTARGLEIDDKARERMDRLLQRGSDERDMRFEQQIGRSLSRGGDD